MAQYLLSVWHDEDYVLDDFDTPEVQRVAGKVDAFNRDLEQASAWVFAGGLLPRASATVVRVVADDVSMTDGPYAEAKEHMGGFWVIEAPDKESALDWARRGAAACELPVELRPFQGG